MKKVPDNKCKLMVTKLLITLKPGTMTKGNKLSFKGETIFCGLDVHKKGWQVNVRDKQFELADFSQPPSVDTLIKHLHKRYPGADYKVAYEAGFCGFEIHRSLKDAGIECLVVNPADVPSSDKEKRRKQDSVDARKICRELASNKLESVYIPSCEMEHARSLIRYRHRLVNDQTRCKNRIWSLLMFSGIKINEDKACAHWSKRFIMLLKEIECKNETLREALNLAIEEYVGVRKVLSDGTKLVRKLSTTRLFAEIHKVIRKVPGIGLLNAMILQTEIMDIRRFRTLDSLCSYAGIVPDMSDSGDTQRLKGITYRTNIYLRPAIIESSWIMIRTDPAMLMKYKQYCYRMHSNKAIVKIARHLLARIRYVWMTGKDYQIGVVA